MENQQLDVLLGSNKKFNKGRDSSYVCTDTSLSKVTFRRKEKPKRSNIIEESYDELDECVKNVECAENQLNKTSNKQSSSKDKLCNSLLENPTLIDTFEDKKKESKRNPRESEKITLRDSHCSKSSEKKKKKSPTKNTSNFQIEQLYDDVNKQLTDEMTLLHPCTSPNAESKKERKVKHHVNDRQDLNISGNKPEHGGSIANREIEAEFHDNLDVELVSSHKKKHKRRHESIGENRRDQLYEHVLKVENLSISPSTSINSSKEISTQENIDLCEVKNYLGSQKKKLKDKHKLLNSNYNKHSKNNNEGETISLNDSISCKRERKNVERGSDSNEIDQACNVHIKKQKVEDEIIEQTSKKEKKRKKQKINNTKNLTFFQTDFPQHDSTEVVGECHNSDEGYTEVRLSADCVETENPQVKHKKKKRKNNKNLTFAHTFLNYETLEQCNNSQEEIKDKHKKKHKCDADEMNLNITEGNIVQHKKRKTVNKEICDTSQFELSSLSKDNEAEGGGNCIEFELFDDLKNKKEVHEELARVSQSQKEKVECQMIPVGKDGTTSKSKTSKYKSKKLNSRKSNINYNTANDWTKNTLSESTSNPENQNEKDSTEKNEDKKVKKKHQHCDENVILNEKQKRHKKPKNDIDSLRMQLLEKALSSSKSLKRKSFSKPLKKYNKKQEFKGLIEHNVEGKSSDFLEITQAKKKRKKNKQPNEIDMLTQNMISKALINASKSSKTHIPHVTDSSKTSSENLMSKTAKSSNPKTKFKHHKHKQNPHSDHSKLDVTNLKQVLISTALQKLDSGSDPVKEPSHSSNRTQLTTQELKKKKETPSGRGDLEKSIHHSKKKKVKTKDNMEDITSRLLSAALAKANV